MHMLAGSTRAVQCWVAQHVESSCCGRNPRRCRATTPAKPPNCVSLGPDRQTAADARRVPPMGAREAARMNVPLGRRSHRVTATLRQLRHPGRARRFYWRHVRRYDGEICHDCGRPVARAVGSWWRATDLLWLRVVRDNRTILCPRCFIARADAHGITGIYFQTVAGWSESTELLPRKPRSL